VVSFSGGWPGSILAIDGRYIFGCIHQRFENTSA
jgi:hypothetical protein